MIPAICLGLLALTWVIFGQTLRFGFVNYDDNDYVYDNPNITNGLTWTGIRWAFTQFHADNWHPLTTVSHMLDCQFYGLRPWGHHLTNILLHATAAILLFLALQRLTGGSRSHRNESMPSPRPDRIGNVWPSAFVAATFAIHPLRVESVAWISERKDVLSGVFFMLILLAYAHYARRDRPSSLRYAAVLLLFALGLMCKPTLVTLPFVLLLLDYWPLRRFGAAGHERSSGAVWGSLILEKIPLLVLSAASSMATILAQREAFTAIHRLTLSERVSNAIVSYVAYLGQMIYPLHLAVLYPYPEGGLRSAEVILAFVLLLVVSVAFFLGRKKYPFLLVGWAWFAGMLVPMIGLVQVGSQARADRYTYLPQIGLYLLTTWGVIEFVAKRPRGRETLIAVALLLVTTMVVLAHGETASWRNSETLWQHAVDNTANNHIAHNSLGNALLDQGRLEGAIEHYKKAIAIKSDVAPVESNLGNALLREGMVDEAIVHFQKAMTINPGYAEAYNEMGGALMKKKQADPAVAYFQKAVQLNPKYAEAHNNLGAVFLQNGHLDEAINQYREAVVIKPDSAEMRCNLGNALAHKGDWAGAIDSYRAAVRIRPNYDKAHNNLGVGLETIGRKDEALEQFSEAVRTNGSYAQAQYNLGRLLMQFGRRDEARAHLTEALRLQPDYPAAKQQLLELGASLPP